MVCGRGARRFVVLAERPREPIGTCSAEGYGDYRAGACGYTGPESCVGELPSVIHRETEDGLETPTSVCTGAPEDPPECQCACEIEFFEG